MRDLDQVCGDADPVEKAREYRDQLKAELACVDAFLAMAEELSSPRKRAKVDFWLWDDGETPATLH